MVELELESLHADGEHLILRSPDGQHYRLVIDESLRTAVRRDRPHLEALRARESSVLRPKDIQSRIRAGASAEEVAAEGAIDVEAVRRYEGPVQAERSWIAQQTRALPIGREVGAPTLGDLVMDRLAARGVTGEADWDAVRRPGEPWEVSVTFAAGGTVRGAHWQVDLTTRSLTALDDESRWLSETELTGSRRPVRARPFDVEHEGDTRRAPDVVIRDSRDSHDTPERRPSSSAPPEAPGAATGEPAGDPGAAGRADREAAARPAATEALLDQLDANRGRRSERPAAPADSDTGADADADADERDAGPRSGAGGLSAPDALFPVAPVLRLRQASPRGPQPSDPEQDPEPEDEATAPPEPPVRPTPRGRGRARRTSIPSWDEIVFGAKQD